MDTREAWSLIAEAELLHGRTEIELTLDRLAGQITAALADECPLVLCIMGGGVVFAGELLPRLGFPLEFDYLHATRYRGGLRGGEIEWAVLPRTPVEGRVVLVLDDILDEGHTLAATKAKLLEMGAVRVEIAVLTEKDLGHDKPVAPDYVGLRLPNRFVFGMGMDVHGMWRNLPAIYAMKEYRVPSTEYRVPSTEYRVPSTEYRVPRGEGMGTIKRFEDLIAWQKARVLTREIYTLVSGDGLGRDYGLKDQLQRAAVSIMANIAEGFERGTDAEFHRFLTIARGSCAEVRSHLYVALDVGHIEQIRFTELMLLAEETARVLGGLKTSVSRRKTGN